MIGHAWADCFCHILEPAVILKIIHPKSSTKHEKFYWINFVSITSAEDCNSVQASPIWETLNYYQFFLIKHEKGKVENRQFYCEIFSDEWSRWIIKNKNIY